MVYVEFTRGCTVVCTMGLPLDGAERGVADDENVSFKFAAHSQTFRCTNMQYDSEQLIAHILQTVTL